MPSDGALIIDTGLDNEGFIRDSKQFKTALETLVKAAEQTGQQMSKGANAYTQAISRAQSAARGLTGEQAAIQKEIAKTEARLQALSDKQEIARRKFDAAREAAIQKADDEFRALNAGMEAMPWESPEQAAQQFEEDLSAHIQAVIDKFGVFEETAPFANLNAEAEVLNEKLSRLKAQLEQSMSGGEDWIDRYRRAMDSWDGTAWREADMRVKPEAASTMAEAAAETERAAEAQQTLAGSARDAADGEEAATKSAGRLHIAMMKISTAYLSAGGGLRGAFAGIASAAGQALGALGKFAGHASISFMKKLASGAKNAAIQLAKMAGNAIKGGMKKLGGLIGGAAKSMFGFNRAAKMADGGLKSSLMSVLKYGLGIRGLFMLFRKLRTAVKEGFEAMAQSSPTVKGALDSLQGALNGLKGSLATAFAPILTAVAPALTTLINMLTSAINAIGAFMAALTGQKTYQAAVAGLEGVGGAASGAAGSVKDLKRQLAGFDQLNILSANQSGGGGGGGGGSAGSGLQYETQEISGGITDFVAKLKELWANADYEGIGREIAGAINGAFEKAKDLISWDALGGKITQAVDTITGIFNGLVDGIDWDLIGKTFGTGINTILNTINQLLTKIDWANLGKKLAEGLSGLVDEVDWALLGDTIGKRFEAMLVAIGSFAAKFDWENLGKGLANGIDAAVKRLKTAINKIKWKTIGKKLASGINTLFDKVDWTALAGLMKDGAKNAINAIKTTVSTIRWGNAGTKLASAINGFFADKSLWKSAGETVSEALHGILDFTKNFVVTFDAVKAAKSIKALLGGINWPSIASAFWETAKTAFKKAGDFVKILLGGDVYDEMGDAVDQLWERGSGDASSSSYAESWTKRIAEVASKIGEALGSIDWPGIFDTVKKTAWDAVTGFVDGLFSSENGWFIVKLTLAVGALKTVIQTLLGGLSTTIVSSLVAAKTAGKLAVSSAASGIGTAGETAFAAAAVKIGTAALAALDAMLIVYDATKISEAAKGYKEAGEAYAKEIDTALESYKTLYDTKGKEVADAWAAQVYGIDTTDCSLVESQQLLVDSITDMWGDAPRNWKDALREGWDTYFGENGKGVAGLLGDAGDSFLAWLGLGYEEPVDKGPNGDYTIGLKPIDDGPELSESAKNWATAALVELDKGKSPPWLIRHAKALGANEEELRAVADALGVTEHQMAIYLQNNPNENPFASIIGDEQPTVDVGVDFVSQEESSYKNGGLIEYLQKLFAPGTDTETRVALLKDGWTSISSFVGTAVTVLTSLGKSGWTSISSFVGTAVTVLTSLGKNGWTSIGGFVGTAVTVATSLKKNGWTSIGGFVGTAVTVLTSLKKNGWKNIGGFVGTAVTVLTSLKKKGWTSIGAFVGTAVTVLTSLKKKGWTSIGAFVGTAVTVATSLKKNGWTSIGAFVGTAVTTVVSLSNQGSNWASGLAQWITGNRNGAVSITTNLVAGAVTGFAQAVSKIFFGKTGGVVTANGVRAFASGGMLTGSGRPRWWDSVRKYATGTSRAHGTLFAAGEAGPEIVGHINGRTEILNRSQLASTMFSAVENGMLSAIGRLRFRAPAMSTGSVLPYDVAAQIAATGASLETTLNANNEDLIQTIISVAGQIVAAIQRQSVAPSAGSGGPSLRQIIDGLNRQTQMFGVSPLKGV